MESDAHRGSSCHRAHLGMVQVSCTVFAVAVLERLFYLLLETSGGVGGTLRVRAEYGEYRTAPVVHFKTGI